MSTMRLSVSASMRSISRKCRGAIDIATSLKRQARLSRSAGHALQCRRKLARTFEDLRLANVERRQQTHDVIAGAHRQQLLGYASVDHIAVGRLDLDASEQSAAAHLLDDAWKLVLDAGQFLLKAERDGLDVLEETRLQDGVEHGIADGHGQRVAAEGGTMRARLHALGRFVAGEEGTERKPATDTFG